MTGILLVGFIPLAVIGLRRGQLRDEMMGELNALGRSECAKVAKDVYLMLRAQHEKLKKEVRYDLNVAEYVMEEAGGLSLSQERVHWTAQNQFSGQSIETDLPKVLIGNRWIEQNMNPAVLSPVVDKVRKLVGARCTIFQRMNESGDLLRACTNVLKKDSTRAIGTYIPATEPDGTANPVVAAVLRGKTYVGRAYVIDDWYLTAYEPIFDAKRKVIGALFCGVRLEDIPELRKGIVDITVGRTGYAYVLGGSGEQKGRYVISRRGLRDGENIYDSQDASGEYFIRSIIEKAKQTKNGDCQFTTYAWRNPGEESPRRKVAAATYFEPWDWVIGVGTYEDDFQDAIARVDQAAFRLILWGSIGAFMAFALCGVLGWVESGRIAAMNHEIAQRKLAQARQGRMLQRLESLNQLHKDLLLPGSLTDNLKKVTDAAVETFELDFCRIWHIEPGDLCSTGCIHATAEENRHKCLHRDVCLHLMASSGRYTHIDGDHRRVPLGCYKIGLIVTGQDNKFLTNNVTTDPRVHNHEWAASLGLVSFAGYKLCNMHGDPIGVLAMFAKHALSEEDYAFLSNLAETTSGVIVARKAEEALRESERRLANIIDFLPDATFAIDHDGKVIAWNRAIEEMTRVPAERMLGHGDHAYAVPFYGEARPILVDLIFKDDTEIEAHYRSVRRKGTQLIAESVCSRLPGGKNTYLWIVAAPLYNSSGQLIGAIESIRDITELRQARDEAQAANRAKTVFLANMSHELRTPLNAVLGFSELMQADTTLSESQKENLSIIKRSGTHLLGLINDVLEISKIEADRVTREETSFDLWNTLETIKDMMHSRAKAKGLLFILECDPTLPRYVRADERKLKQVILNLAGNAVKFTQQGKITLRARAENGGTILRFQVEDTGPGIDAQTIPMLFEPFAQGRQQQEGAGLGLFISRKLVEFMGGQITVQSEPGKGSVFSFDIHCEAAASAEIAPFEVRRVASLAPGQKTPRILAAEDILENRLLMTKTLRSRGFEVVEAVNGAEAVQLFDEHQPDLVLMDMRMPVMDGYEAIRRIRSTRRGEAIPIIAVTASAFEEDRQKILAVGADDFIRKPVQGFELFEKIRLLLNIAYIYTDERAEVADVVDQASLEEMVGKLPEDLTDQLIRAIAALDLDGFKTLLPMVALHNPHLADQLKELVDGYQMTELAELLPTTNVVRPTSTDSSGLQT